MIYKTLLLCFLLFNYAYASLQEVRIGKIDRYYQDKINEDELRAIIDEIEEIFEAQLDMNLFDYSEAGKAIDILYLPASKLEKRINRKIKKLQSKKNKIKKFETSFAQKQEKIDRLKIYLKEKNRIMNKEIENYNAYIKEINQVKIKSKKEYNHLQKSVNKQTSKLDTKIKKLKKEERNLKKLTTSYNNKVIFYNASIGSFNRLKKEIESMNRSFKKVKGVTKSFSQITMKSIYKNGIQVKEKSIKNIMSKIEIYGFESLDDLKVVLAHEIGHLLGIPHINVKDALMNPILQEKQKNELFLTPADVLNFEEHF